MIRSDLPNHGPSIAMPHPTHDAPSAKRPLPSFLSRLTPDGAVSVVVISSFAMGVPARPRSLPARFLRYRCRYGVDGGVTFARLAVEGDADCDENCRGNCRMRISTAQRHWCAQQCSQRKREARLDNGTASSESVATAGWIQRPFGTTGSLARSTAPDRFPHAHARPSGRSPQRLSALSALPRRPSGRSKARSSHDRRTTARC